MTGRTVRDRDKLLIIAQTYYYIKGRFTAHQLYSFLQSNDFKFHGNFSARQIGAILQRSNKFNRIKGSTAKYEVA